MTFRCKKRKHFALCQSGNMDLSYPRKCMFSTFACINRDGQMKSESGKYAAFAFACNEIWWAIKGCQKT